MQKADLYYQSYYYIINILIYHILIYYYTIILIYLYYNIITYDILLSHIIAEPQRTETPCVNQPAKKYFQGKESKNWTS